MTTGDINMMAFLVRVKFIVAVGCVLVRQRYTVGNLETLENLRESSVS